MSLIKLPPDLCDLFYASSRINTYKKAVEELVYNSLDAKSTCIAIRVNIEENSLQVIDNGEGILQADMKLLGHKNTTSKVIDMASLKAPPETYGFKGQSLSSIVKISEKVTITSKSNRASETMVKIFSRGTSKSVVVYTSSRPSKGTTVEINGFLYNLSVQNKAINPLNELHSIKGFLQRLALVHNNVSISLRDDSVNEIVFNIHRCKDIYQTLKTMFDVQENDIQELKVEKNQFKVTAYITKTGIDTVHYNWIYLNGRFMNKCVLHKIVEDSLRKLPEYKHSKRVGNKRVLFGNNEETVMTKKIPGYFIFVVCPYKEYNINDLGSDIVVEFNKTENITVLLQKLIKFYSGDINIQEIPESKKNNIDTRDKVKEIMTNLLKNDKNIKISQMYNGVKGKVMKRKFRKSKTVNSVAIIPLSNKQPKAKQITESREAISTLKTMNTIQNVINNKNCYPDILEKINVETMSSLRKGEYIPTLKTMKTKHKVISNKNSSLNIIENNGKKLKRKTNGNNISRHMKIKDKSDKKHTNKKRKPNKPVLRKETNPQKKQTKIKNKNKRQVAVLENCRQKSLVETFKENNDIIKSRCNIIKSYADNKFNNINIRYYPHCENKNKISTTKNKIIRMNKNFKHTVISFDKVETTNTTKLIPIQLKNYDKLETHTNVCKSSYDLLQTILKSQKTYTYNNSVRNTSFKLPSTVVSYSQITSPLLVSPKIDTRNESHDNRLTYDSHKNGTNYLMAKRKEKSKTNKHFITKYSEDNFKLNVNKSMNNSKKHKNVRSNLSRYQLQESSYTIQFSSSTKQIERNPPKYNFKNDVTVTRTTNTNITVDRYENSNHNNMTLTDVINNTCNTCTIRKTTYMLKNSNRISQLKYINPSNIVSETVNVSINGKNDVDNDEVISIFNENILDDNNARLTNNVKEITVDHIPKSQSNTPITVDEAFNPITLCETILNDTAESIQRRLENIELTNNAISRSNNMNNVENDVTHISHYFDKTIESILRSGVFTENEENEIEASEANIDMALKTTNVDDELITDMNFELKQRPRYIPKGMSPIFSNCNTKVVSNYNPEDEYFNDDLYENFVRDVEINTDVFEANIESVNDYMSKEVQKFNKKLNKDNADLSFDGDSLKNAQVIGQIDCKFIAAKMKCTSRSDEYLIMFDQHAVHERIKLEKYLSEYFVGRKWKSVKLEKLTIKVNRDVIIFLHNYKKKFVQFGLKWDFGSNEEINVFEIPEAIIGKNIRPADVIMKSVRNLIFEEIEIIKAQGGSVSLYPKSIMDLVFSEACRYAIKFGDKLSHSDCCKLIKDLSECKTPFQCAHGRPVMAVLIQIDTYCNHYKIDKEKLQQFMKNTNE